MAAAPAKDLTKSNHFWDWLSGVSRAPSSHHPWAVLKVLADAYPSSETVELQGPVILPKGAIRIVAGNVKIRGNLEVSNQALLVVLGNLSVEGGLVVGRTIFGLAAARELVCKDGFSIGEVLVLETLRCAGSFYFADRGDDDAAFGCRARAFDGGALVDDFTVRESCIGSVRASTHLFNEGDLARAARALGLEGEGVKSRKELREAFVDSVLRER